MTSNRNIWIVAIGLMGVLAGLALIFANQPIGRALIIASTIGASLAIVRKPPGDPDNADNGAWFGPKRMGYGWGPRNWKGYALVIGAMVLVIFLGIFFAPVVKT